jgi:hypothetical protein
VTRMPLRARYAARCNDHPASTTPGRKRLLWLAVGLAAGTVTVTTGFRLIGDGADSSNGVMVHKAEKTEPAAKYWTPERIRRATGK